MMTTKFTNAVPALAVVLLIGSATTAAAAPAAGQWRSQTEDGVIEIYDCGEKLCGRGMPTPEQRAAAVNLRDVKNPDPALRSRPLNGIEVLQGFAGGPKVWTGGSIYRPQDGKTYKGRIELVDDNTLKLTGCVMEPFCKSIIWKRAS
jgi:uncharacterized protein (DUF2147 family)